MSTKNVIKQKSSIKVAVAMSGGVDSSVAAALCVKKYGKDNVFGLTMKLFCYEDAESGEKSCCSLDAVNDARAVCEQLGIAHYAIDMEKEFEEAVIKNFIEEYQTGHTPNPCIRCNQIVKFNNLLLRAKKIGANFLATGHYARIKSGISKEYQLLRGLDDKKDQSYFLYGIDERDLKNILFPIGDIPKTETRKIAQNLKLKTAKKKESQEICFITSGNVNEYLRRRLEYRVGDMLDRSGNVIGKHEGVPFYTLGQRKGLGGGFASPMYVTKISAENNSITVGSENDLYAKELFVQKLHWMTSVPPKLPLNCTAKIRYNMTDTACIIGKPDEDGKYRITFKKPQRAITNGQSIVFYQKEFVLGGGIISAI